MSPVDQNGESIVTFAERQASASGDGVVCTSANLRPVPTPEHLVNTQSTCRITLLPDKRNAGPKIAVLRRFVSNWSSVVTAMSVGAILTLPLAGCGDDEPSAASHSQRNAASLRAALTGGRDACRGKTPATAAGRFLAAAKRSHAARAAGSTRALIRFVEHQPKAARRTAAFAELAARVYALTLPRASQRAGFTGCFSELQSGLASR